MHPFLPALSLVLLGMADLGAVLLWRGLRPEIAVHRPALLAVIGVSFLFGAGLGFWLRRFRFRFPGHLAFASGLWIAVAVFSGFSSRL